MRAVVRVLVSQHRDLPIHDATSWNCGDKRDPRVIVPRACNLADRHRRADRRSDIMGNWIASWIPRVAVATVVVTVLGIVFWPTLNWSLPKTLLTQGARQASAVVNSVQVRAIETESAAVQAFRGNPSRPNERRKLPMVEARPANSGRISFLTPSGTKSSGQSESVQKVDGHPIAIQPMPSSHAGQGHPGK